MPKQRKKSKSRPPIKIDDHQQSEEIPDPQTLLRITDDSGLQQIGLGCYWHRPVKPEY